MGLGQSAPTNLMPGYVDFEHARRDLQQAATIKAAQGGPGDLRWQLIVEKMKNSKEELKKLFLTNESTSAVHNREVAWRAARQMLDAWHGDHCPIVGTKIVTCCCNTKILGL